MLSSIAEDGHIFSFQQTLRLFSHIFNCVHAYIVHIHTYTHNMPFSFSKDDHNCKLMGYKLKFYFTLIIHRLILTLFNMAEINGIIKLIF